MRCRLRNMHALWGLLLVGTAWGQDPVDVRIGFLLNFARFVEWPETQLPQHAPLRVCLAPGDVTMDNRLARVAQEDIKGRPMQVKQVARDNDVKGCHVLYLPAETPGELSPWLNAALQTGALTVGDLPDFIQQGGMIGLVPVGGRYRFDINLGVARQADLRVSSQLLKLAGTVK
ncbi:MAG: YfiR family protein [Gammaproteobacteria bacterium]|nr:YfiR family protein [Rhodoferax sp.]MBU3898695.1 YfiR family protein [Gammaproteobacteria bacterium]MBU4115134.1 YfiR family protein [Gammaproteobacteria bacterium]